VTSDWFKLKGVSVTGLRTVAFTIELLSLTNLW